MPQLKTQCEQQSVFNSIPLGVAQGGNEESNLGLGHGLHMIQIEGANLGHAIFWGQYRMALR